MQTGWLHHDTLVEFKLYERAVHIWKRKHLGKDLFVKVTPVDVAMASQASFSMDLDESVDISETRARNKSWPLVNAAVSLCSCVRDQLSKQSIFTLSESQRTEH